MLLDAGLESEQQAVVLGIPVCGNGVFELPDERSDRFAHPVRRAESFAGPLEQFAIRDL